MKYFVFAFFIPTLLSFSLISKNNVVDVYHSKSAQIDKFSVLEEGGKLDFKRTSNHAMKVTLVPLITDEMIDDTTVRVELSDTEGCSNVVYKLSGIRSNNLVCPSFQDHVCGKKYDFVIPSNSENQVQQLKIVSGANIMLVKLTKISPIT